jgi:hypothetical protein
MNSNFASWGNGGAKGLKGAGKGLGAWQSWEDKPCTRCGGKHLARECPSLTNGKTCHKCGRTGHAANCCTSEKVVGDEICKGCGEKGHIRKECQATLDCSRCKKKGHTEKVCTQPADYKPQQQDQKRQAANQGAAQGVCRPCGDNELFLMKWKCPNCEKPIRDDSGTATKCPSCHTAKEVTKMDVAPKSHLPQCKAATERELERAQVLDATGNLPPTTTMQEAMKQAQDLESYIERLEGLPGAEDVLATKKKELAALRPKLPVQDQALKDHSDVRLAIKDLAEKRERGEKDLKDKIARLLDAQQETVKSLGKQLKAVEEKAA